MGKKFTPTLSFCNKVFKWCKSAEQFVITSGFLEYVKSTRNPSLQALMKSKRGKSYGNLPFLKIPFNYAFLKMANSNNLPSTDCYALILYRSQ